MVACSDWPYGSSEYPASIVQSVRPASGLRIVMARFFVAARLCLAIFFRHWNQWLALVFSSRTGMVCGFVGYVARLVGGMRTGGLVVHASYWQRRCSSSRRGSNAFGIPSLSLHRRINPVGIEADPGGYLWLVAAYPADDRRAGDLHCSHLRRIGRNYLCIDLARHLGTLAPKIASRIKLI